MKSGNFIDTVGQTVSDRLGVNKCAAVVELCVICVHVRMEAVFFSHTAAGSSVYAVNTICGMAGINE